MSCYIQLRNKDTRSRRILIRVLYQSVRKTPSFECGDISASSARAIDGAVVA